MATLTALPIPMPANCHLILLHPELTAKSLETITQEFKARVNVWNYHIETTIGDLKLLSLSSIKQIAPSMAADCQTNIYSLAKILLEKSHINLEDCQITCLGGDNSTQFIQVYNSLYQTYVNSLNDNQKMVLLSHKLKQSSVNTNKSWKKKMVVIDKSTYSLTSLKTDMSYLGLLLEINSGNLNDIKLDNQKINLFDPKDPILPQILHLNIDEIPSKLTSLTRQLHDQTENRDTSIAGMKEFVGKLSGIDVTKKWLSIHMDLTSEIFKFIKRGTITQPEEEEEILQEGQFGQRLAVEDEIVSLLESSSSSGSSSTLTSSPFITTTTASGIQGDALRGFGLASGLTGLGKFLSKDPLTPIMTKIMKYIIKWQNLHHSVKLITMIQQYNSNVDILNAFYPTLTRHFDLKDVIDEFDKYNQIKSLKQYPKIADNDIVVFLGSMNFADLTHINPNTTVVFTGIAN